LLLLLLHAGALPARSWPWPVLLLLLVVVVVVVVVSVTLLVAGAGRRHAAAAVASQRAAWLLHHPWPLRPVLQGWWWARVLMPVWAHATMLLLLLLWDAGALPARPLLLLLLLHHLHLHHLLLLPVAVEVLFESPRRHALLWGTSRPSSCSLRRRQMLLLLLVLVPAAAATCAALLGAGLGRARCCLVAAAGAGWRTEAGGRQHLLQLLHPVFVCAARRRQGMSTKRGQVSTSVQQQVAAKSYSSTAALSGMQNRPQPLTGQHTQHQASTHNKLTPQHLQVLTEQAPHQLPPTPKQQRHAASTRQSTTHPPAWRAKCRGALPAEAAVPVHKHTLGRCSGAAPDGTSAWASWLVDVTTLAAS
jgi:hypothetical protein